MGYWYDIVKSYDDPKSKGQKRDDGTYSQFSTVILLMYLFFGESYPYKIAEYFEKLFEKTPAHKRRARLNEPGRSTLETSEESSYSSKWWEKTKRISVLYNASRIGTLLNKMEEDGLVNSWMTERCRYYEINPEIISSPAKGETYFKSDGSTFEIHLEKIERLLAWQEENIRRFNAKDLFFKTVVFPKVVDYITFLIFIEKEARFQETICHKWIAKQNKQNKQNKQINILSPNFDPVAESLDGGKNWYKKVIAEFGPNLDLMEKYFKHLKPLSELISEYIDELDKLTNKTNNYSDPDRERRLSFEQFTPKQQKVKNSDIWQTK